MSKLPSLTGVELTPQVSDLGVALVHQRSPGRAGLRVALSGISRTATRGTATLTPGGTIGGGTDDPNYRYVRPGAPAGGTGMTWGTALNAIPATPQRGLTYFLAGGNYAGRTFSTANLSAQRITFRAATVASHGTNDGWSDSYAGTVNFTSGITVTTGYWTFDGQVGGGPGSWRSGFAMQINSQSITDPCILQTGGADNVYEHIKFIGLNNGSTDGGGWGNDGIALKNFSTGDAGYFRASYIWFQGIGRCPVYAPAIGFTGFTVEYSYIDQYNFGSSVHGEVMSGYGVRSASAVVTWRYNVFTDMQSTGGLQWDNSGSHGAQLRVYGNIFYKPPGRSWATAGNGMVGGWTGGNGEDWFNVRIYNNTFYNFSGSYAYPIVVIYRKGDVISQNNVYVNGGSYVDYQHIGTHNYNHAVATASGVAGESQGTTSATDPYNVNATTHDFTIKDGVLIPAGLDLAAPYNLDMYGNPRQPGNWTRGAIQKV